VRLNLSGNQGKFPGWRQRQLRATIVPPDSDKIMVVGFYPEFCHCTRSFKLILDVIARNRNFTSCVWHSHL
jgi:hypothetical protein